MKKSTQLTMMTSWINRMSKLKSSVATRKYFQWVTVQRFGKVTCHVCGNDDMDCMEMHHRDGNRKNNNYKNLLWRCCNCHSKLHVRRRRENKKENKRYIQA